MDAINCGEVLVGILNEHFSELEEKSSGKKKCIRLEFHRNLITRHGGKAKDIQNKRKSMCSQPDGEYRG